MKNMTLGAFAFASALALASTPGRALTFDFSFTDGIGTVTGEIEGLTDNSTGPATAVFIDSAPPIFSLTPSFSVPVTGPDVVANSFTVSSGVINAGASTFLSSFIIPDNFLSLTLSATSFLFEAGSHGFQNVQGPTTFSSVPGSSVPACRA